MAFRPFILNLRTPHMMFSIMTIVRSQSAHWTAAPTESVRATETVIGTIGEGSIRHLYSYGRFLATRIRELSLPPEKYALLPFDGKIRHDEALLPLTRAKDEVDALFWKEMVKAFPAIMIDLPSVRVCVDWQVAISTTSFGVMGDSTRRVFPMITQLTVCR